MTEAVRDALFSVIRFAMGEGTPPKMPSAEICGALLQVASRQSILPIVYDGLKEIGAPAELLAPYEVARLKDGYDAIQREVALHRVRAALDAAAIPYVLLKGAVLCQLYPHPDWRTSCDIDILVPEEQISAAIFAIEDGTDFHSKQRNYHDVSLVNDHVHLELHFSLKENMPAIDPFLANAWERATPAGHGVLHAFSPEFQLFHIVSHMAYHMVHGGLGIRNFLDLWLLRHSSPADESTLRQLCDQCGILTFYNACLALISAWFDGRTLPGDLTKFEAHCLDGGVFGSESASGAARLRGRSRIGHVFRRVFPGKELMLGEFPGLKGRPWRWPWYTFKRWSRLLSKPYRDIARSELSGLKNTQTESVADFDSLLKNLGL